MTIDDLAALAERVDLACKAAQGRDGRGELPEDFWKSYSAMANAEGGVIWLGIQEKPRGQFTALGLPNLDRVRKALWEAIGPADRTIFEACAAQEYHLALADARAHALIAGQIEAPAKWPVRLAWPDTVSEALDQALAEVVERIAASDASARRIHDSYQAFRHLLGEDIIA